MSTINCEEIEIGEGVGYKYLPTEDKTYPHLTLEDKEILDAVIYKFGNATTNEIVNTMHHEDAYTETAPKDVISFKYAKTLSLS